MMFYVVWHKAYGGKSIFVEAAARVVVLMPQEPAELLRIPGCGVVSRSGAGADGRRREADLIATRKPQRGATRSLSSRITARGFARKPSCRG